MKEQLLALERASSALEPDEHARKALRDKIISYTEGFLNSIEEGKAFFSERTDGKGVYDANPGIELRTIDEIIDHLKVELDQDGINPASGGHLGYIPGGGIYASSLADYWAAISNRYAGVFFANPGAVRIENKMIRWLSDLVGYPDTAHGNLASGGSVANMIGVVVAREAMEVKARQIPDAAIYMTKQGHHSLAKAIKTAALEECHIRYIPMDEHYRMSMSELRKAVENDVAQGIRPFLILGSAGTTDVGAVDPLDAIADIAAEYKIWFHLDAAYGGFFALTEEAKHKFKGMERSDSLVIDPHKGLFIPYGLGVCLVRNGEFMKKAFTFQASYLQDINDAVEEINPMDVGPEMTKHFRGLRLWIPIMLYGLDPFIACLREKLLLAKYFHQEIQKIPGFEVGPPPELSVVTFRFLPANGDADEANKKILHAVQKDGRIFFSSTTIDGHFTLRLAILSFRTHVRTIDLALEMLKEIVDKV